jgi:centrosomal protein CEP104
LCLKCKQIVEVSALNFHHQNECEYKKDFRQCPRCKEIYLTGEYNQHVAEKMCMPAKNANIANRCPLCHTDNTPAGKVGWEVHLIHNTCPNNPRTNS